MPFDTVGIGALRGFIQEWNSPNFQGRETWPFIALLFGLMAAAGMSRLRLDWTDFALVAGTAFMALLYGRNIAVFAVPATVALTYYVDDILQERGWVLRPVTRHEPDAGAPQFGADSPRAVGCPGLFRVRHHTGDGR
ncbi:hypothetical protein HC928_18070 [bacterium]|nr:hypothetical protein [bacterium]